MDQGHNIRGLRDSLPQISSEAYVNPDALIVGDVVVEAGASVWPGALVRGDGARVLIGEGAVVLDKALIEAWGTHPVEIGPGTLVSHGAVVRGSVVEADSLVGIRALIQEGSRVGKAAVIGAGAVVTAGSRVEARCVMVGVPAVRDRTVTGKELNTMVHKVEELRNMAPEYGGLFSYESTPRTEGGQ